MSFEIASMIAQDYDALIHLWSKCEGLGAYESPIAFKRFLDRNPGMSVTAWKEGAIIGAVLCGHDGRRGYLHHLAVDPDHRQEGVGKAIVEKCLARLEESGIQRSLVFVFKENENGMTFWSEVDWRERVDLVVFSSQ